MTKKDLLIDLIVTVVLFAITSGWIAHRWPHVKEVYYFDNTKCYTGTRASCGMALSDCLSGATYNCAQNVKIERKPEEGK